MSNNSQTIVFVNYISRSGSTFLCSELAKLPDVSVGIEAGFPGFPDRLIPKRFVPIRSEEQLNEYLNLLFADIRFKEWGLDRTKLTNDLKEKGWPIEFSDVFKACFEGYFSPDKLGSVWVHKAGGYLNDFEFCNAQFPSSKQIFVVRDPRSIYNSQKTAKDLYSTGTMGVNVMSFISEYQRRVSRALELAKHNKNVLLVKYEEMVDDLDSTLVRIKAFIGYVETGAVSVDSYSDRIPENQRSLHANVGQSAKPELKTKWKKGLTDLDLKLIEEGLKGIMLELSYEPFSSRSLSLSERFSLRFSLLKNRFRKGVKLFLLDNGLK